MKKIILCLLALHVAGAAAFPFMIGARVSTPQIASVSLSWRPTELWFVQVEPGVGGGKAALGIGGSWGYHFGLGLKSSLLYTWGKTWGNVETGQTYAEMIKIWTHPRHDWNALVDDGGCMAWGCSHLKTGSGGIMALPHLGNWEIGARLLESLDTPVTVLYRPPRQPYLEDFLVQRRRNRILRPVPIDLSGIREAEAALQRDEIVMIIADQVPKRWKSSGVIAPFFGQPAVTMKLINRLARRHKVPVGFYYIYRTGETPPYKAACFLAEPEIASDDPQEAAVALNHCLERCIRAHPEQYQWVYRRFVKAVSETENPYHRPRAGK